MDENLGMRKWCSPTAWKADSRKEGCIRRGVVIREREMTVLLYSVFVRLNMEYLLQHVTCSLNAMKIQSCCNGSREGTRR